jgi:hypothetical protein
MRWLKVGCAVALLFVGIMGFLHTAAGRPLLAALGVGCPGKNVSPSEVEAMRQRGLTALRGTERAASRPAFGLVLDESREFQVVAWAAARGLTCTQAERPTRRLSCQDVPSSALQPTVPGGTAVAFDEVNFTFFPDGRLLGVETLRRKLTADAAARLFGEITARLNAQVGRPTERTGDASAAYLNGGAAHTAFARYRYADYLATVTAMNLVGRVALREQYQSAVGPG